MTGPRTGPERRSDHTTRLEKLTADAGHLLDVYLRTRATYALLNPLLFDQDTVERWGRGARSRGFRVLVNALLYSCVLDVAKLTLDRDKRTSSLYGLCAALDNQRLVSELREAYAGWAVAPPEDADEDVLAALRAMDRRHQEQRRAQFDQHLSELRSAWATLQGSSALRAFVQMRNKLIAHNDLSPAHDGSGYKPLDVGSLGLKYGDLRAVLADVERVLRLANAVVRNASFDYEEAARDDAGTAAAFWAQAEAHRHALRETLGGLSAAPAAPNA